jgi:hypothetical protein
MLYRKLIKMTLQVDIRYQGAQVPANIEKYGNENAAHTHIAHLIDYKTNKFIQMLLQKVSLCYKRNLDLWDGKQW